MLAYHLAQLDIGVIRGPMDSPVMTDFAGNLDRINDAFPAPDAVPPRMPIRFNDECPAV